MYPSLPLNLGKQIFIVLFVKFFALIFALIFALTFALIFALTFALIFALTFALIFALIFATQSLPAFSLSLISWAFLFLQFLLTISLVKLILGSRLT